MSPTNNLLVAVPPVPKYYSTDYPLVSTDGPLCEAILAIGPTYHPNLVIMAADLQFLLAQLVQQLPYPLLLVPPESVYHPIKRLALAYDTQTLPTSESIRFVKQLALFLASNESQYITGTLNPVDGGMSV